ncbi:MAG: nitroreductase family protein [Methanoculleaceae archaeon]
MNLGTTIIKSRRSIRAYRDEEIPEEVIRDALECARLAPTARNAQAWLFGVITDRDLLSRISDLTTHGKFIKDAAICFAVFGEREHEFWLEDCCAATTQIILALQSHGVGSCWVAGAGRGYADPVRDLLGVPDRYSLASLIPAGYPADARMPPKKRVKDVVFWERFGREEGKHS